MANPNTPLLPRFTTSKFVNSRVLWRCGAIMGQLADSLDSAAVGMAAGAFGAHSLKRRPNITQANVQSWLTASHYLVYNGLAVLAISLHPRFSTHRFAAPAIITGACIFSGSIVALVLNQERFRFFGPVTPLGGAIMISGYLALAL